MRNTHPLLAAASSLAGSTLLGAVTGAGFWMVAAHSFGDTQVGLASTTVAALTLVALLCAQPLNVTVLTRLPALLAAERATGVGMVVAAVTLAASASAVLGLGAALALPHLLGEPAMGAAWVTIAVVVAAATQGAGIVLDAAAIAARAGKVAVTRNAVQGAVKLTALAALSLGAAALSEHFSLPVPAAGTAIGTWALGGVAATLLAVKQLRTRLAPAHLTRTTVLAGARVLRAGAGAQVLGVLAASTPSQVIPLVVAGVAGAAGAAAFSMSWMIAGMLFMVSTSLCSAALTTATATSKATRWKMLGWGHVAALSVGIAGTFIAGQWVLTLAGMQNPAAGAVVLQVLVVAGIPNAAANLAVSALRIAERLRAVAVATCCGAGVTLALAVPAVNVLGPAGGAWAWAAGQVVTATIAGGIVVRGRHRAPASALEPVTA